MTFAKEALIRIGQYLGVALAALGGLGVLGALAPYAEQDTIYRVLPPIEATLIKVAVSAGITWAGVSMFQAAKDRLRERELLAQWAAKEESTS